MRQRSMKFALSMRFMGYHSASWRHPDVPAGGAYDFGYNLNNALIAERGKFDMVFFADGVGIRADDNPPGALARSDRNVELEPITLLAALAPMTSRIGLVATASTTYNEPYHIARKFASLDMISGGRAGWNIVTSWSQEEAWNFSREEHLDHASRYERATEFVEVVTGLWDSWEGDAFLHDKQTGQFYDPAKLHVLDHRGRHFQVRGPLSSPRTPQGRPVLVQAGASDAGQDIAAVHADVVYSAFEDLDASQRYYTGLKARAARHGREPDDIKIMPAVTAIIGRTRAQAQAKYDEMQDLIDPLAALGNLYRALGDLSAYPLDGPVPEPVNASVKSLAYNLWDMARQEGLSIEGLARKMAGGSSGLRVIGTADDVADALQHWMEADAADGFVLTPTHLPHGVEDFVSLVVPELQRRGLYRTEYEGTTLRENLGLSPVRNRYASAGR